jgi:energy-converting hydrogenase Eha subunit G
MSFALYMIGFVLLIGGVAWALVLAGVSGTYVAVVCLILAGVGVITGVSRTRTKDISH